MRCSILSDSFRQLLNLPNLIQLVIIVIAVFNAQVFCIGCLVLLEATIVALRLPVRTV